MQKSAPQNLKFDFDLEFFGQEIDFENLKFENHFLQFRSNFDLGPKNLNSPSQKTTKS